MGAASNMSRVPAGGGLHLQQLHHGIDGVLSLAGVPGGVASGRQLRDGGGARGQ